ncbi:hypothetical protein [Streptomyces kaempferi]|uniref:Uncharacterized protein n=1 Tax=Streptomyces kaempferi TaxID=333725 RepID=A0ABW3XXW0_9ACTN
MIEREKFCVDTPPELQSVRAQVEHAHKVLQILVEVGENPPENWEAEAALTVLRTVGSSRLIAAADKPEGLKDLLKASLKSPHKQRLDGLTLEDIDNLTLDDLKYFKNTDLENLTLKHLQKKEPADQPELIDAALEYFNEWNQSLQAAKDALLTEQERDRNQGEGSSGRSSILRELEQVVKVAELRHQGVLDVLSGLGIDHDELVRRDDGTRRTASLLGGAPNAYSQPVKSGLSRTLPAPVMSVGLVKSEFFKGFPPGLPTRYRERYEAAAEKYEERLTEYLISHANRPESENGLAYLANIAGRAMVVAWRGANETKPQVLVSLLLEYAANNHGRRVHLNFQNNHIAEIRKSMLHGRMSETQIVDAISIILEMGIKLEKLQSDDNIHWVDFRRVFLAVTGALLQFTNSRSTLRAIMKNVPNWDRPETRLFDLPYVDGFIRYRNFGQMTENQLRRSVAVGKLFPDEIVFSTPSFGQIPYISGLDALRRMGINEVHWQEHLEDISNPKRSTALPEDRLQVWSQYVQLTLEYERVKKQYEASKDARQKAKDTKSILAIEPSIQHDHAQLEKYVWRTWVHFMVTHEKLQQLGIDPTVIKNEFDKWVRQVRPGVPMLSPADWRRDPTSVSVAQVPYIETASQPASSRSAGIGRHPQILPSSSRTPSHDVVIPRDVVIPARLDAPSVAGSSRPLYVPAQPYTKWSQLSQANRELLKNYVYLEFQRHHDFRIPRDWEQRTAYAFDAMPSVFKNQPMAHQANHIASYVMTGSFNAMLGGARGEAELSDPKATGIGQPSHDMEHSVPLVNDGTGIDAGVNSQAERQDNATAEPLTPERELIIRGEQTQGIVRSFPEAVSTQITPHDRAGVIMGRLWQGAGDTDKLLPVRGVQSEKLEISAFIPSELWDAAAAVMSDKPTDSTPQALEDHRELVKRALAPLVAATQHNVLDHLQKMDRGSLNTLLYYRFTDTNRNFSDVAIFIQDLVRALEHGISIDTGREPFINICA